MSWESTVIGSLGRLGFSSVSEFVAARPGATYGQLSDELEPPLVLPIMVMKLQLQEARAKSPEVYRAAAADSLARSLSESLTEGWGKTQGESSPEFMNVAAWSAWASTVDDDRCLRVFEALKERAKPGWRPSSGLDPVIVAAFDEAWPIA
jgi:hypothetical protein